MGKRAAAELKTAPKASVGLQNSKNNTSNMITHSMFFTTAFTNLVQFFLKLADSTTVARHSINTLIVQTFLFNNLYTNFDDEWNILKQNKNSQQKQINASKKPSNLH